MKNMPRMTEVLPLDKPSEYFYMFLQDHILFLQLETLYTGPFILDLYLLSIILIHNIKRHCFDNRSTK